MFKLNIKKETIMNKKEIRNKVNQLLSAGKTKNEVFKELYNEDITEKQLAFYVAAYANPKKCEEHSGKVKAIIAIILLQAVIAFFSAMSIFAKASPNGGASTALIVVILFTTIMSGTFAWFFYKNNVAAYNAYILLTIVQFPNSLKGFTTSPVENSIGLAIALSILGFIWHVRNKIFPDFKFMSPVKVNGEYVFKD